MSRKLTIEEMQKIAQERGGRCLSEKYVNGSTKLRWQCKEGHEWEAIPFNVKNQKTWCPKCKGITAGNLLRGNIEEMQQIAIERGGKCLSEIYKGNHVNLKWQCKEGHIWDTAPSTVKSDKWCPFCAGNAKSTIEEMQNIAKARGGLCLSTNYVNAYTKLKWQCKEGHIWENSPGNIKRNQWCPACAGLVKSTIEQMQKLAEKKGGKCLSEKYVNSVTKLKWQCMEGHEWEAVPASVKSGCWCPICSEHISERICRKMFENIFNEKFPKIRPEWLVTPWGTKLELDGYCKKLGIAFEYQGAQHYKSVPMFRETRSLDEQKTLDELKRKKCEENNVLLIEVPYFVDYEKMPEYIVQECKKRNIVVPELTESLDYKLMNIYSPEKLKEMQELAKIKGGVCLSDRYINAKTKLRWRCKDGHIWENAPTNIKQGQWCAKCYGNVESSIEEMQKLAEVKGGKCLSEKYRGTHDKLKWQCDKGHIWDAEPSKIKSGKWCPFCAGNVKSTIEEMQKLADERGGKCLSEKYVNNKTKLKWQCKEGHIWEAVPSDIKSNQWCPHCSGRRQTIEDMQKLAEKKGGKCLSEKYISATTKLRWQCKEGHVWETTPNQVKNQNSWCPKCAHNKK